MRCQIDEIDRSSVRTGDAKNSFRSAPPPLETKGEGQKDGGETRFA